MEELTMPSKRSEEERASRVLQAKRYKHRYPEKEAVARKKYRVKHLAECRARRALHKAVARGKVVRGTCVVCGSSNAFGHHEDYSKRFEVVWLCATHHSMLHNNRLCLIRRINSV